MNGLIFNKRRDRRLAYLTVSAELLLDILWHPQRHGCAVRTVSIDNVPDGCEVDGVCWDEMFQAFRFRLWHPSFAEVPDGEMIPPLSATVRVESLRLADGEAEAERLRRLVAQRERLTAAMREEAAKFDTIVKGEAK